MANQKQDAREGAAAIQAGRDVVVHQRGLSLAQMKQILDAVAGQFPAQIAAAKEIFDVRIAEFERRMLERFHPQTGDGNSDAFGDPDFLYVLRESQHAYVRSGDTGVRETLIDLITRRSRESSRNRLSLTLNEAVQKSAVLTRNEFAELSLCYLIKLTVNTTLRNMGAYTQYLQNTAAPLMPDVSREHASYQYLEAQSCASIGMGYTQLSEIIRQTYMGLFSQGYSIDEFRNCFPPERKQVADAAPLGPGENDQSKLQLAALNKMELDVIAVNQGWNDTEKNAVWGLMQTTTMSAGDVIAHIGKSWPQIYALVPLWDETPLNRLNLTTVGIAIGHANLVRLCNLGADLAIWIK